MKLIGILLSLAIAAAVFGLGLFYYWPQAFTWLLWEDRSDTGESMMLEYQTGNPSIRVGNGKIVAQEQYELSFPFSGEVESVAVLEGQHFAEGGQTLVQLEKTEWLLELKKAEAQYAAEQAIVSKLEQGARFEELLIAQQKKQSSDAGLKGTKKEVLDAITAAFVQSDDAVRNKTDVIFTNPETNPQLSFTPSDTSLESDIESGRVAMKETLDDWEDNVNDMKESGNILKYLDGARDRIKDTREYLDQVASAVNVLSAGALSQDTIDAWKIAVAAGRTNVAEVTSALSAAESAYRLADKGLSVAKSELDLKLAGTQRQDIEAALSAAVAARSQMDIIAEKLKKTTLVTPSSNLTVKKIFPKPGEYVAAGQVVAVLMKPSLEIEVDVPEEKIAGIVKGNRVIIRLNAYPYEDFFGTVTEIKTQEIEKDGGIYFRVRASLENVSEKIRTGMTGDVVVETNLKAQILRVPKGALYETDGRRMVTVIRDGGNQAKVVESGIEKDGLVEILSGLQSGEQILYKSH